MCIDSGAGILGLGVVRKCRGALTELWWLLALRKPLVLGAAPRPLDHINILGHSACQVCFGLRSRSAIIFAADIYGLMYDIVHESRLLLFGPTVASRVHVHRGSQPIPGDSRRASPCG